MPTYKQGVENNVHSSIAKSYIIIKFIEKDIRNSYYMFRPNFSLNEPTDKFMDIGSSKTKIEQKYICLFAIICIVLC